MRALIREAGQVRLIEVPRPALRRPDDVLVEVGIAGICRTDLYVADGAMGTVDPITLGHELCGRVIACGPAARLAIGTRVTADPRIGGGFLGVTHHGAFAEYVLLPAGNLHPLPDHLDARLGAYVEPVAAALAIPGLARPTPHSPQHPDGPALGFERGARIAVFGENRFAHLIERVLRVEGFEAIRVTGPITRGSIDVGVETTGTADELAMLVAGLRRGGQLVLKSRTPHSIELPEADVIVRRAHYGSFARAIELLAGSLDVADLLGDEWPLSRYAEAFARARAGESHKLFLRTDRACVG